MAAADKVVRRGEVVVYKPVPDGPSPGLESDLLLADIPDGPDSRLYDIDPHFAIDHPCAAARTIARSAVSPDGKEVLKTEVRRLEDGRREVPSALGRWNPAARDVLGRAVGAGKPRRHPEMERRGDESPARGVTGCKVTRHLAYHVMTTGT